MTGYRIILMGAPGCGKGTQAARLSARLKATHISTGDMFRAAVKSGSELGKKARLIMDSGELVPDEITIGLVRDRLSAEDCRSGFILDGFPRNGLQAAALGEILSEQGAHLSCAVNIEVSESELIERITGRWQCKECGNVYHVRYKPIPASGRCDCGGELYQRSDDKESTVRRRLAVYNSSIEPLKEYYKRAGLYRSIDGNQPIDDVTEELISVIVRG